MFIVLQPVLGGKFEFMDEAFGKEFGPLNGGKIALFGPGALSKEWVSLK